MVFAGVATTSGACVLPGYEVTSSSGTSNTTTSIGGGGTGGTTSSQGGAGGTTGGAGGTGGTTATAGTAGTDTGGSTGGSTKVQWVSAFGGALDEDALAVAPNPQSGEILAGGTLGSAVNFSVVTLDPAASGESSVSDGYLLKLDGNGTPLQASLFEGTMSTGGAQSVRAITFAPDGSKAIAVCFTGSLDLTWAPQPEIYSSHGAYDCAALKYNSAGTFLWATHLAATGDVDVVGLAIDSSNGAVIAAGTFAGSGKFAAEAVGDGSKDESSVGGADVYVVSLAGGDGAAEWVKTFGSVNDDFATGFAADPAVMDGTSNIWVAGHLAGNVATPLDNVSAPSFLGATDAFAFGLTTVGDFKWAQTYGDAAGQRALGVGLGPPGTLVLAGDFDGTIHLPTQLVNSGQPAVKDMFVARLSRYNGTAVGAEVVPDLSLQGRLLVTADTAASPGFAVAGNFDSANGIDAFVHHFGTIDQVTYPNDWSELLSGSGTQRIDAIAAGPLGALFVAGSFTSPLVYGGVIVNKPGTGVDLFVAKLQP